MRSKSFSVGQLAAERGERAEGWVEIPGLPAEAAFPVVLVNGAGDGPTLAVTGGVHGAEYPGIAAAIELARTTDPAGLAGRLVVVPVVNVTAYRQRSIYVCPLDGKNPNRVFPG